MIVQKTFIPNQKIYVFHLFNGFYHFDIIKQDNRKYKLVCACVIMETFLKKIYLFMSFRTSRDMVGRFFTMLNANIDLCSQVRPNFL